MENITTQLCNYLSQNTNLKPESIILDGRRCNSTLKKYYQNIQQFLGDREYLQSILVPEYFDLDTFVTSFSNIVWKNANLDTMKDYRDLLSERGFKKCIEKSWEILLKYREPSLVQDWHQILPISDISPLFWKTIHSDSRASQIIDWLEKTGLIKECMTRDVLTAIMKAKDMDTIRRLAPYLSREIIVGSIKSTRVEYLFQDAFEFFRDHFDLQLSDIRHAKKFPVISRRNPWIKIALGVELSSTSENDNSIISKLRLARDETEYFEMCQSHLDAKKPEDNAMYYEIDLIRDVIQTCTPELGLTTLRNIANNLRINFCRTIVNGTFTDYDLVASSHEQTQSFIWDFLIKDDNNVIFRLLSDFGFYHDKTNSKRQKNFQTKLIHRLRINTDVLESTFVQYDLPEIFRNVDCHTCHISMNIGTQYILEWIRDHDLAKDLNVDFSALLYIGLLNNRLSHQILREFQKSFQVQIEKYSPKVHQTIVITSLRTCLTNVKQVEKYHLQYLDSEICIPIKDILPDIYYLRSWGPFIYKPNVLLHVISNPRYEILQTNNLFAWRQRFNQFLKMIKSVSSEQRDQLFPILCQSISYAKPRPRLEYRLILSSLRNLYPDATFADYYGFANTFFPPRAIRTWFPKQPFCKKSGILFVLNCDDITGATHLSPNLQAIGPDIEKLSDEIIQQITDKLWSQISDQSVKSARS